MAPPVGGAGPRGDEAGPDQHHPRNGGRAGSPRGGHQLRCGHRPRKAGAPRRDEPRLRLRPAVPQGRRHHPSGCYQLLRGRQHRHHRDAAGAGAHSQKADRRAGKAGPLRRGVQGHALHGLHPLPARPAHHRGQARDPVGQRAGDGPCRDRPPPRDAAAPRRQGHHRHTGLLYGAVQGRCGQDPRRGCVHCVGDGLRPRSRHPRVRPDLQPQGGFLHPQRAGGHRPELHEVRHRPASAGQL